eukprot:c14418_g1_i1.p1 GENE.c14418_g1_i1~~c14418_g1_i1.p1  ORF type:complete len:617 (+),score=106.06 c14418_g1_i1:54-1853(+)
MGGDSYDRPVYSAPAPAAAPTHGSQGRNAPTQGHGAGFSAASAEALARTEVHPGANPRDRSITCNGQTGIVVAVDVTGSMGNWSKIMYDKLPMFFGQLILQDYVPDPTLCFAGIGDALAGDNAPLQVTEFRKGIEIDGEIKKLWLEGRGGGNQKESYLEAMLFFASPNFVRLPLTENGRGGLKPFFFITGDEGLYDRVEKSVADRLYGERDVGLGGTNIPIVFQVPNGASGIRDFHVVLSDSVEGDIHIDEAAAPVVPAGAIIHTVLPSSTGGQRRSFTQAIMDAVMPSRSNTGWERHTIARALRRRYHVFHIRKANRTERSEPGMRAEWEQLIGADHVLTLHDPKACVDIMLGAIAIVSGARTLEEYIEDLVERGQTPERQAQVREALAGVRQGGQPDEPEEESGAPQQAEQQCEAHPRGKWETSIPSEVRRACEEFHAKAQPGHRLKLPPVLGSCQRQLVHIWGRERNIVTTSQTLEGRHASHTDLTHAQKFVVLSKPRPEDAPSSFYCPITSDIMEDPVITDDGQTYDRESISRWFQEHDTSPLTGLRLPNKRLIPNIALRRGIDEWKSTQQGTSEAAANDFEVSVDLSSLTLLNE